MASRARDRIGGRARPRGNDPLLRSAAHQANRRYWLTQGAAHALPCARCGRTIDYTAPCGHPRALIVGHIVSRAAAKAAGWTAAQINARSNTQPECTTCSATSGARSGNDLRRYGPSMPASRELVTSEDW
jgi:hypothetical protein